MGGCGTRTPSAACRRHQRRPTDRRGGALPRARCAGDPNVRSQSVWGCVDVTVAINDSAPRSSQTHAAHNVGIAPPPIRSHIRPNTANMKDGMIRPSKGLRRCLGCRNARKRRFGGFFREIRVSGYCCRRPHKVQAAATPSCPQCGIVLSCAPQASRHG